MFRTKIHYIWLFEIFKLIFENAEDKNPLNWKNDTLLYLAAMKKGQLEICKYFLRKVENKNLAINFKNNSNKTPIDVAARYGNQQLLDYLRSVIEN